MNKEVRMETELVKGYRVKVELKGSITDYALNFLHIYNNVKSSPELLNVYNDYENGVYVVCEEGYEDQTEKWLSHFGEIKEVEEVTLVMTYVANKKCNDFLYDIDEVEFAPVKEW